MRPNEPLLFEGQRLVQKTLRLPLLVGEQKHVRESVERIGLLRMHVHVLPALGERFAQRLLGFFVAAHVAIQLAQKVHRIRRRLQPPPDLPAVLQRVLLVHFRRLIVLGQALELTELHERDAEVGSRSRDFSQDLYGLSQELLSLRVLPPCAMYRAEPCEHTGICRARRRTSLQDIACSAVPHLCLSVAASIAAEVSSSAQSVGLQWRVFLVLACLVQRLAKSLLLLRPIADIAVSRGQLVPPDDYFWGASLCGLDGEV